MKFNDLKFLVTQSFAEWSEDKASRLAAALAYYTIFSIPPLLILAIAIAAQIFDRSAVRQQMINLFSFSKSYRMSKLHGGMFGLGLL